MAQVTNHRRTCWELHGWGWWTTGHYIPYEPDWVFGYHDFWGWFTEGGRISVEPFNDIMLRFGLGFRV